MTSPRDADAATIRLRGVAFRACSPDKTDLVKTAAATREDPGRFNTERFGAVYLSREPDTAIAEVRRMVAREGKSLVDAHPCAILAVTVDVDNIVDLTTPVARAAWGLSLDDLQSDDMDRCREAAAHIARAGASGVRWPSAAANGQSLALYIDQLSEPARVAISNTYALSCEMLHAIERGTSATQLVSALAELPVLQSR